MGNVIKSKYITGVIGLSWATGKAITWTEGMARRIQHHPNSLINLAVFSAKIKNLICICIFTATVKRPLPPKERGALLPNP